MSPWTNYRPSSLPNTPLQHLPNSTKSPSVQHDSLITTREPRQIRSPPLQGTLSKNRYRLTGDGLRFAIFYNKLHDRLLRPLLAAEPATRPATITKGLHTIDIHITETIDQARFLPNAA